MSTPSPPHFLPSAIRQKYRNHHPPLPTPYRRKYTPTCSSSIQHTNSCSLQKTIQGHHTPFLSTAPTKKIKKSHHQVSNSESDTIHIMNEFATHEMTSTEHCNVFDESIHESVRTASIPSDLCVTRAGSSLSEKPTHSCDFRESMILTNDVYLSCLNSSLSTTEHCNVFDESIHESIRYASIPSDLRVARAGSSLSEKPTHSCNVRESMILTNDGNMSCLNLSLSPRLNNKVYQTSQSSFIPKKATSRYARRNNFRQRNKRRKRKIASHSTALPSPNNTNSIHALKISNHPITLQEKMFDDLIDTIPLINGTNPKSGMDYDYDAKRPLHKLPIYINEGQIRFDKTKGISGKLICQPCFCNLIMYMNSLRSISKTFFYKSTPNHFSRRDIPF